MSRQARISLPDGIFHVTARAVFDLELFVDDDDRRRFLWLLADLSSRFNVRCLAYCLMCSHYHLLLQGRTSDLRALMHRLNGAYARRFNERHCRHGHVFGERYTSRVIQNERQLDDVRAYIEANPFKSGLCDRRKPWPWLWFASTPGDGLKPVPT